MYVLCATHTNAPRPRASPACTYIILVSGWQTLDINFSLCLCNSPPLSLVYLSLSLAPFSLDESCFSLPRYFYHPPPSPAPSAPPDLSNCSSTSCCHPLLYLSLRLLWRYRLPAQLPTPINPSVTSDPPYPLPLAPPTPFHSAQLAAWLLARCHIGVAVYRDSIVRDNYDRPYSRQWCRTSESKDAGVTVRTSICRTRLIFRSSS